MRLIFHYWRNTNDSCSYHLERNCAVLNYVLQLDMYTFKIKIHKLNSICHCYRLPTASTYFTDCYVWWKHNAGEMDLGAYLIGSKFSGFPYSWEFFLPVITSYYCHLSTKCYYGSHIQMHFQFYSYFWATDSCQSCGR